MALTLSLAALTGCKLLGWNAEGYASAWDELRCDRRTAVFVNLRLDTTPHAGSARERGSDFQVDSEKDQSSTVPLHLISPPFSTSPASYNRALAYLHSRNVSEVTFLGRTTAHGTISEFRALDDGFSSIPDPAYKTGHAKITWTVPRTYHFAHEDTQGKYHPRTFWPRIFNTPWSDTYVSTRHSSTSNFDSSPALYLLSHYGTRCHIRQLAYVTRTDTRTGKTTSSWVTVKEWDETQPSTVDLLS